MKKLIVVWVSVLCLAPSGLVCQTLPSPPPSQQQPPQSRTPQPGKKFVQTPFGMIEVDESDPRPAVSQPVPGAPPVVQAPVPAAPATQPPAPSTAPADAQAPILLHLDNADIYQVIKIIGDALGLNYVIDPAVKGTVNISTSDNLRRSDLLPILETILKVNGATMVQTGNFYQIVPANTALRMPLEVREAAPQAVPDDQIVLQVVRMKYVAAAEMSRLLTPYLSEGGNIVVQEAGNVLLVSDRRSNLRKLLEIVDVFDTNIFEGERVRVFPVRNALARDLSDDLQKIFAGYAMSDNTTAIRFIPIERLNSVLIVTPNALVFPEVEKWVERLDQQSPPSGFRNYVYRVRNGKAKDIQRVLAELYGYTTASNQTGTAPGTAGASGSSLPPGPSGGMQAGPVPGGLQQVSRVQQNPVSSVRLIADDINNALVIQGTPQEYAEIERTIQQLDVLPRQVLIDAQVYEVVLGDSLSLGISAILQNRGTLASPQTTASFASAAGAPASFNAQTFAFIGRTRELIAYLTASENRSRVRSLSAPSVLVSDNMQAEFQVGAEVPIPTSSSVTPVQSGGTNLFAQTIQFRNTGVILRVKPQINESGNVTIEIAQEVSQASSNTTSAIVAPVIGKSSVSSTIVVPNGQTIALSGFIRESSDYGRNRVPWLGSIPGLGLLFGNTRRSNTRTELIVLITPHVLRTSDEANLATEELKKKLREIPKFPN